MKVESSPSNGRVLAWESSRVVVLDGRVVHRAAAGAIQAGGLRFDGYLGLAVICLSCSVFFLLAHLSER